MPTTPPLDPSRWQQERERCRLSAEQPPPGGQPVSISQVLREVFGRLGGADRDAWRGLEQTWAELAGAAIARHARPVRLENKVLTVAVDNSVWLNELRRYEGVPLLQRLQAHCGAGRLDALRFHVDPRAAAPERPPAP